MYPINDLPSSADHSFVDDASAYLTTAERAARAGGDVALEYFRESMTLREKSAAGFVTDADIESEQAIAAVIEGVYPEHVILAEETLAGDTTAEHLWIVDPIDGTTNFAHGIPHFSVSVAYYHQGRAVCGVVWNPARDDLYTARAGKGAYHNGVRQQVNEHASLTETLIGVGFYYDRGQMMECTLASIRDLFWQNIHGIRRFGTASLDLCHVGVGYYGAFFEYQLSPWDFAAGRLFVEEAGGRVTTARGEPLPLARSSLLASNGPLHDAVLEITGRHHP